MARDRWDLAREKAKRQPKRRIIIYCEGKKTEPAYFRALERHYRNALIRVETIQAGVPMTVAERAVARAIEEGLSKRSRRKPKNFFEEGDQVWAAFDVDDHPRFDEAVALCVATGVGVCRSNPCFEVWLILHEEEFHSPIDRHGVCARLQILRPEYNSSGAKTCDFGEMVTRVAKAETRAKMQLAEHERERAPFGRPSTTAGELTAAIREAAEAIAPKR